MRRLRFFRQHLRLPHPFTRAQPAPAALQAFGQTRIDLESPTATTLQPFARKCVLKSPTAPTLQAIIM
jgi:hypothetical protein